LFVLPLHPALSHTPSGTVTTVIADAVTSIVVTGVAMSPTPTQAIQVRSLSHSAKRESSMCHT
jgi:hypothetical protein